MFVSVKKRMMKIGGLLLVLPLLLVGCVGGDDTMELPTKQWGDIHITVQTRPPKVKAGMVEFMVLAAIKGRKPENELVVSLRMEGSQKWHQAIQDGFLGVYRRVVQVRDPARDVLAVKLRVKKSDKEKILYFPLALQQPTNTASE
ncbi:hypothetical protein MNBD_GAMMA17-382 [hydrothermal vent metagenome]|uniref:Uncharacterized protein n=1 Tax=hydrothermal vent metagenome TaxID=652676 RepID=A0A3B0ZAW0_9ZZZZ